MSRLKRLKERKIKNRIKATSCGLALALVMGASQGVGTYALFTDTENMPSDIAISTGDVDVEVSKGAEFEDVQPGSSNPYIYTITNKGTLRQQLKLDIDISKTVVDETLNNALNYLKSNISYSADFGIKQPAIPVPDNEVGGNIAKIDNIKLSEEKILKNVDGNIFILEPGQQITVNATVNIPNMDLDSDGFTDQYIHEALNKIGPIVLDVNVEARQISNNINQFINYGFFDIESQANTINIGEFYIAPEDAVIIDKLGNYAQRVRIYESLIGISNRATDFSLISKETIGLFSGATLSEHQDTITISGCRVYDGTQYLFGDEYGKDVVTIAYNEDNIAKKVKFDFVYNYDPHGSRRVIVKYTITSNSKLVEKTGFIIVTEEMDSQDELEIVEPPKEEVEVPSEPEVVKPSKEETEVPSEPEVVEPPKEEVEVPTKPEVVEPPKAEETVVPSQPDVIAPSKEETEIQE